MKERVQMGWYWITFPSIPQLKHFPLRTDRLSALVQDSMSHVQDVVSSFILLSVALITSAAGIQTSSGLLQGWQWHYLIQQNILATEVVHIAEVGKDFSHQNSERISMYKLVYDGQGIITKGCTWGWRRCRSSPSKPYQGRACSCHGESQPAGE